MGLFGFGNKENVVDLAEKYRLQKEREASGETGNSENAELLEGTNEEKRKKLAKRILDLTNRLEDMSTKMYHLQQRIELLERKTFTRTE